ncbi:hypothetical protein FRC19_007782 [Serendipita sp. 401]|nr:hypothetical protein FRC19_007782 [Serendipita sp. 401]KAG9020242.1 hypothetical protein FS842_007491 [Serendipita sp. 407]
MIQYFRASSFALASLAYTNTLVCTSISDMKDGTSLPQSMEYSPFRERVDGVTENALAIVNTIPGPTSMDKFIQALGIGGIFIFGAVFYILCYTYGVLANLRVKLWKWRYGDPKVRRARHVELRYENYP